MSKRIAIALMALVFGACSTNPSTAKRYSVQGEIKAVDPAAKTATIKAGKIGDWMDAMTMEYPVKPDADIAKLHIGDTIRGTVVVNDLKYYVTDVTVVPKP